MAAPVDRDWRSEGSRRLEVAFWRTFGNRLGLPRPDEVPEVFRDEAGGICYRWLPAGSKPRGGVWYDAEPEPLGRYVMADGVCTWAPAPAGGRVDGRAEVRDGG